MFDDEEGDDWLPESDDWWQQEPDGPDMHIDQVDNAVNQEGESVHAALNSRLRRSTRMTFFNDESGNEEMQLELDDINLIVELVDRRGWPEFSKAAKFVGAWKGMVFKRGPLGMGYYRDEFKLDLKLAKHPPAVADAAPVTIRLEDVIASKPTEKASQDDEPETCPRRRRTSTGRKSKWGRAGVRVAILRFTCCELDLPRVPRALCLRHRQRQLLGDGGGIPCPNGC